MSEATRSESTAIEQVRALVQPIASDLQLDVYDLEFRGGTLRITLDTPVGSSDGVDLDTIALATRLLSKELDQHDPVPGHYTLEISSPGVERMLRTPAHFQRELGKQVAVRLRDTAGDARRINGVLVAADNDGATIRLAAPGPAGETERVVPYTLIDRARTVFVWGPAPKPGARQPRPASSGPENSRPKNSRKES